MSQLVMVKNIVSPGVIPVIVSIGDDGLVFHPQERCFCHAVFIRPERIGTEDAFEIGQTSGRAAARAVAKGKNSRAFVEFKEHSETWLAKFRFGLALALLVAAFGVPQDLLTLLPAR